MNHNLNTLPETSPQYDSHDDFDDAMLDVDESNTDAFDPDPGSQPGCSEHEEPWFPWKSRAHFYLTVLYHGSHRRNIDQTTLRAIMDILKIYVPPSEYFPSLQEIVNFTNDHWESKLFESRIEDGNVFSFLRPEGLISMRLANPVLANSFDRVPRQNTGGEITTQSSAGKWKSFDFRKLGALLQGDVIQFSSQGRIAMEGFAEKVDCQIYFQISSFYIEDTKYKVKGSYFFHSSLPEMNALRERVNDDNCLIKIKNLVSDINFEDLNFNQTLRSKSQEANFSKFAYDESTPPLLYLIPESELQVFRTSLSISEREGCVQVVTNIHIDDASQVQSKMWKSASVCDIQFAGAPAGIKGSEHNNVILALTDTSKISLKRLFDGICGEFHNLSNGFHCYDSFSGKVEKVKAPIAAVFGDLPAKAEITPFKGFQADVFCSRDMYNKRTEEGLEIRRDLGLLRRQIAEVTSERTATGKKRLGVKFGLDVDHLETVLFSLDKFDLTQDLPADLLHHFTLGWGKKSFIFFKNEILSDEALNQLCEILDQIIWKEYKSRTNSNALRKAGSQIGRNIKSLLQLMWYGVWVLIGTNPEEYRADLEIFLRAFFYLGKLNYLFYNEHEVGWTPAIFSDADDAIKTAVAIFRRDMEVLVPGPKTHDLENHLQEDISRHGNPAGFDCQAGESKMKVQKLKNNYSNKHAPGKDVATKYMKTEIVRHICT